MQRAVEPPPSCEICELGNKPSPIMKYASSLAGSVSIQAFGKQISVLYNKPLGVFAIAT